MLVWEDDVRQPPKPVQRAAPEALPEVRFVTPSPITAAPAQRVSLASTSADTAAIAAASASRWRRIATMA